MNFGTKLKMLRIINKLDQERMSERLNISQPVYSRYETGDKLVQPTDEFVRRVAEEFNVSSEWLTSSENSNIIFEAGSIAAGANGIGQIENYYTVPKDFLEAFLKQQKTIDQILEMLANR